jgi:hypothetical protein
VPVRHNRAHDPHQGRIDGLLDKHHIPEPSPVTKLSRRSSYGSSSWKAGVESLARQNASALGCAGFQYNVYDGSAAVLVEADSAGTVLVSGIPYDIEDEILPLEAGQDRQTLQRHQPLKAAGGMELYFERNS